MTDEALLPRHGGALRAAAKRYGIPLADWLDLSTGVNPEPYPLPQIGRSAWSRLPDPDETADLLAIARRAYGVTDKVAIAAVPGSDIALRLLPRLRPPGDVAILSPTYSGHAEGWRAAGHAVRLVGELKATANADATIVLTNPNNPDGRVTDPASILALATQRAGRLIVVDEAFADLDPTASIIPRLSSEPVAVLRSFGKFHGLAGIRLGFVVGQPDVVGELRPLLGDWPISGPALQIAARALRDSGWAAKTRLRLALSRERLDALLATAGLDAIVGTDLFRLVRSPRARDLHEALARQGVWTRIFAEDRDAIRFGIPPENAFDRLAAALAEAGK